MNNITISGNLGRDAKTGSSQGGKFYAFFTVAVNDGKKDGEKQTLWVEVAAFGDYFEKVSEYLSKGTYVIVSGRANIKPAQGDYDAKLQVIASQIELGPNRREEREEPEPEAEEETAQPAAVSDEDIPF